MGIASLGTTTRTARKSHACYWCVDEIVAGEEYIESKTIEDGHHNTFRWHRDCGRAEAEVREVRRPLFNDEPTCLESDIDGGRHERGRACAECA